MEEEKLIIDVETEEERRIDQFLADQMEYSRSFIQKLIKNEAIYADDFEGQRYDVGDKLGFLQATVEFAMKREELREPFIEYLNTKPWEK